jgi:hypothetical protein
MPENTPNAIAAETGALESGWEAGNTWTAIEQPTHSVYYTKINADAVTADAADNGLIRVFKIAGSGETSSTVSLPFEETKGSQKLYWYYQVTEGTIMIAVDVYGDKTNPAQSSLFKHVVLSKDAVSKFEEKGTTKADLMELSYEKIAEVSK